MSCEIKVIIGGSALYLDEGIAEAIVILNEKGYVTTCCCEGHKQLCEGYAQPKRRQEYGQYSPIWISFKDNYLPPYPPNVYAQSEDSDGWKKGHAREFLGIYDGTPTLFISFEIPKRERKIFSGGDVDEEHKRALKKVLDWAKGLPTLKEGNNMELREELEKLVPLVIEFEKEESSLEAVNKKRDAWLKPLIRLAKQYGYGSSELIECSPGYKRIIALKVGDVRVEIPE